MNRTLAVAMLAVAAVLLAGCEAPAQVTSLRWVPPDLPEEGFLLKERGFSLRIYLPQDLEQLEDLPLSAEITYDTRQGSVPDTEILVRAPEGLLTLESAPEALEGGHEALPARATFRLHAEGVRRLLEGDASRTLSIVVRDAHWFNRSLQLKLVPAPQEATGPG